MYSADDRIQQRAFPDCNAHLCVLNPLAEGKKRHAAPQTNAIIRPAERTPVHSTSETTATSRPATVASPVVESSERALRRRILKRKPMAARRQTIVIRKDSLTQDRTASAEISSGPVIKITGRRPR